MQNAEILPTPSIEMETLIDREKPVDYQEDASNIMKVPGIKNNCPDYHLLQYWSLEMIVDKYHPSEGTHVFTN